MEHTNKMNFDTLLKKYIGEYGRFQTRVLAILLIREAFSAMHNLSIIFLAATPDFWCQVPQLDEIDGIGNCTVDEKRMMTSPLKDHTFDSCSVFVRNYSFIGAEIFDKGLSCSRAVDLAASMGNETVKCSSWGYDTSVHADTLTTQWDLVCDDAWKKSNIASIYMAGIAAGNVVFSWFSDRFGRKKVVLACDFGAWLCAFAAIYSPNYVMYLSFRFLLAFLMTGSGMSFVWATELVGPKFRVFIGFIVSIVWQVGFLLLPGLAYWMRFYSWKTMNLTFALPQVSFFVLALIFCPESPRWLYLEKRTEEADKIVKKMARWNKADLPENFDIQEEKVATTTTALDLVRTPYIRFISIILIFNWAACGFIYYGINLNVTSFGENPYLSVFYSALSELPAIFISLWIAHKFGRVKCYVILIVSGGLLLLVTAAIPEGQKSAILAVSLLGKAHVAGVFNIIWVYSPEVFPTCVRSQGAFITGVGARLAAFISPYILLLADVKKYLPTLLYGFIAISIGSFFVLLPETKGMPLTQTIEELEADGQQRKYCVCRKRVEKADICGKDCGDADEGEGKALHAQLI